MSKYWIYGKHSVIAALANSQRVKYQLIIGKEHERDILIYLSNLGNKTNLHNKIIISENPIEALNLYEEKFGDNKNKVSNGRKTGEIKKIEQLTHQNIFLQTQPLIQRSFENIYQKLSDQKNSTILVLDQVNDPRNIGAIIRSSVAFGIQAIILPYHNSPTETAVMVKAASGAFEKIQLIYVNNLARTIEELKEIGYWAIGFSSHATEKLHSKHKEYNKVALIFGSEKQGVRRLVSQKCDLFVKISISADVESLNISNAVAIATSIFYSE